MELPKKGQVGKIIKFTDEGFVPRREDGSLYQIGDTVTISEIIAGVQYPYWVLFEVTGQHTYLFLAVYPDRQKIPLSDLEFSESSNICTCDSYTLFNHGCQCGFFQKNR